jgi:hypothetical protein
MDPTKYRTTLGKGTSVITTERPLLNARHFASYPCPGARRGRQVCGEATTRIGGRQKSPGARADWSSPPDGSIEADQANPVW